MASFNKVILIGNLTRDPELRVTPKGTAICQFGLAVNRKFKDGSGSLREEVTFVDIEAWDRSGETISKYCNRGSPLMVEGRLKLDTWEDKNNPGQKRSKMKVVLENFQLLSGRDGGGGGGGGASSGSDSDSVDQTVERHSPPPRSAPRAPQPAPQNDFNDEDVPF